MSVQIPVPTEEQRQQYLDSLEEVKKVQLQRNIAVENGKVLQAEYDYKLAKIKTNDGKIFILFTMEGCSACSVVKYITTYDNDIVNELSTYEIIKVENAQTQLTEKYNIYSYPTYFVIDKDENVLKRSMGCNALTDPAKHFLLWLKD